MSVKGRERGIYQGRGGWGKSRSSRGYSYPGVTNKHKGICSFLGNHIFDYGKNSSAHQMRTTWEKLVHNIGTIHGHHIRNGLNNNKTLIIHKPERTQNLLDEHQVANKRRDKS